MNEKNKCRNYPAFIFKFRVSGFKFVYPASIIQLHPNSHSSLSRTEFRIELKAQILSFL